MTLGDVLKHNSHTKQHGPILRKAISPLGRSHRLTGHGQSSQSTGFWILKLLGEGSYGNLLGTTDPMLTNMAGREYTFYIFFFSKDDKDFDTNTFTHVSEEGQFMVTDGLQKHTWHWPCPMISHQANRMQEQITCQSSQAAIPKASILLYLL